MYRGGRRFILCCQGLKPPTVEIDFVVGSWTVNDSNSRATPLFVRTSQALAIECSPCADYLGSGNYKSECEITSFQINSFLVN